MVACLHAYVSLGVLWLHVVVHVPVCRVVVERPLLRLVVDVCHPFSCSQADYHGVLVDMRGLVLVCRVQLVMRVLLSESFAREEFLEEFLSHHHA